MRLSNLFFSILILLISTSTTWAEEGSVTILSPADGAVLNARDDNTLRYEVVAGPHGDHSHLYVDNREVAVLRKLKGSYTISPPQPGVMSYEPAVLSRGERRICIKVVNRNHTPIGTEQCIKVMVQ